MGDSNAAATAAAGWAALPQTAPRRPRTQSGASLRVAAEEDTATTCSDAPMLLPSPPATPGGRKPLIRYEDFIIDVKDRKEEGKVRARKAGKVINLLKHAGTTRRQTAGRAAWARMQPKFSMRNLINQQLLRECGICGRFMLDMDGRGDQYMPADLVGPMGQVPVRCPGCNLRHDQWTQHSLLNDQGIQRETYRRIDILKKQRGDGGWGGGGGKDNGGPSHLQTLLGVSMRQAKARREEEAAAVAVAAAVDRGGGGGQNMTGDTGPRKWTEHPHRYLAWCRRVGEEHPCDHRTCTLHHTYNRRRLRDELVARDNPGTAAHPSRTASPGTGSVTPRSPMSPIPPAVPTPTSAGRPPPMTRGALHFVDV